MSNYLPGGCSDREVEYEYSAPYSRDEVAKCDGCGECNFTERMYAVDYFTVCRNCVNMCDLCGEFLDNKMFPTSPIITIRFAEWQMDGKRSAPHCPKCAADWVLGTFLGCAGTFEADDFPGEWGKDAIAQLLAKAFPLPEKEVDHAA